MIELRGKTHDRSIPFFKEKRDVVKRRGVKPISDKRKVEGREYDKLRKQFLVDNPGCQINWDDKCGKNANQIHHVKGRGQYYLDTTTWLSSCPYCHRKAHDNPKEAKKRAIIIFAP